MGLVDLCVSYFSFYARVIYIGAGAGGKEWHGRTSAPATKERHTE
jgi:hypothetical protein